MQISKSSDPTATIFSSSIRTAISPLFLRKYLSLKYMPFYFYQPLSLFGLSVIRYPFISVYSIYTHTDTHIRILRYVLGYLYITVYILFLCCFHLCIYINLIPLGILVFVCDSFHFISFIQNYEFLFLLENKI